MEEENDENVPKTFSNADEEENAQKPNPRFKHYASLFGDLTKHKSRPTMYPIVHVNISYDSTRAITVTKKDDKEFWVKQYDLETYEQTFEEKIGGQPDSFIRTKEVE